MFRLLMGGRGQRILFYFRPYWTTGQKIKRVIPIYKNTPNKKGPKPNKKMYYFPKGMYHGEKLVSFFNDLQLTQCRKALLQTMEHQSDS